MLQGSFGEDAAGFAPLYPDATDAERAAVHRQIRRDRAMAGLYAWAQRRGGAPTYAHLFTHVMPGGRAWGAFHSSEIPHVFQTFAASPERGFTARDMDVSAMTSACWINVIATGDPDKGPAGARRTPWPVLGAGRR